MEIVIFVVAMFIFQTLVNYVITVSVVNEKYIIREILDSKVDNETYKVTYQPENIKVKPKVTGMKYKTKAEADFIKKLENEPDIIREAWKHRI